jgi:hypothetical protein
MTIPVVNKYAGAQVAKYAGAQVAIFIFIFILIVSC